MLFALAASAGHGVFLLMQVVRIGPPRVGGLRATAIALVVTWFVASIPLALGTLLLRERLCRAPWIGPLAWLTGLVTVLGFGGYVYAVVSAAGAF